MSLYRAAELYRDATLYRSAGGGTTIAWNAAGVAFSGQGFQTNRTMLFGAAGMAISGQAFTLVTTRIVQWLAAGLSFSGQAFELIGGAAAAVSTFTWDVARSLTRALARDLTAPGKE